MCFCGQIVESVVGLCAGKRTDERGRNFGPRRTMRSRFERMSKSSVRSLMACPKVRQLSNAGTCRSRHRKELSAARSTITSASPDPELCLRRRRLRQDRYPNVSRAVTKHDPARAANQTRPLFSRALDKNCRIFREMHKLVSRLFSSSCVTAAISF